ncbi:hypothetical protein NKDENANG_00702 [Candidatus Entotheonellaceae bacterium PAL068K]
MNQVTQQTAANAETASSTAEELFGQSAQMQHLVWTFQPSQATAAASGGPRSLPSQPQS